MTALSHRDEPGQVEQTTDSLAVAAGFSPGCVEAHLSRGILAQQNGDWKSALHSFRQAARWDPTRACTYLAIGNALGRLGECNEAIEEYLKAIRIDPRYADAYNNLGIALVEMGRDADAVAAYAKAIEIHPNHANAFMNLGKVLARQHQFGVATELFERALAIDPQHAAAALELGCVQEKIGFLGGAAACYRRSMELDSNRTVREHLAAVLTHMGDPRGIEQLKELVREDPQHAEARWNLGMGLLRHGAYAEGWREMEWRTEIPRFRKRHHRFDRPRWQGEPLEGQTILLYGEQGHGDTLQFLRYVPLVAARGGRVLLEVPPLLCSMLQGFPGVAECFPLGGAKEKSFSTYASLMSLPHLLGAEGIPGPIAPAGAERSEANVARSGKLKVGLAWAGNASHQGDRLRSIPLADWNSLAQMEGVAFTSLQMGPVNPRGGDGGDLFQFAEDCADLPDFAALAAVVAKLDLVITVDTAVAHLAGMMGKPVWILLSNAADWRWGLSGSTTAWYPAAKLFRQTTPADWSEVMAAVSEDVGRWVGCGSGVEVG